jgi:hypothetical protein
MIGMIENRLTLRPTTGPIVAISRQEQGHNETCQLKNKLMEKNGYKSGKSFKRAMKEAKRLQKEGA